MKMTKKNTKTLLLSAAAALAFGSVAVGTTYALFTSSSENTVEVTSGKVSVTSEVEVKEVYSPKLINLDGTIADATNVADTADIKAVVTGNDVKITKMLPGDKVTLTITPKNDSDVKIKYRETYSFTGDNTGALKVTGDEALVKNWTELDANGEIAAYEIVIELPTTATEEIEEAIVKLGVEAVQGNAVVYDTEVSTEADLIDALNSDEPNISVKVTDDIQLNEVLNVGGNVTIYGDGATKITAPTSKDRVFNMDSDDTPENKTEPVVLKLVGIDIVGPTTGSNNRGISAYGNKDVTIILDNCSASTNYYALNIASKNEKVDIKVSNTTLTGYCAFQTWSPNTTAVFENCTLIGQNDFEAGSSNDFATVVIMNDASGADITFNNCRFEANQTYNKEYFFDVRNTSSKITVDANCSFFANADKQKDEDAKVGKDSIGDYLIGVGKGNVNITWPADEGE